MNIVAEFFGLIALTIYCTGIQRKNKKDILIQTGISNIFYALQYLMLNAYAGVYSCAIALARTAIFYKLDKEKKHPLYVLIVILVLLLIGQILSYDGLISLIPCVTGAFYSIFFFRGNVKTLKTFFLISPLLWFYYNFSYGTYMGMLSSTIEFISAVIAFINYRKVLKIEQK